jgi:site-specific DNA-methyltransferase (adenine-specific)
MSRHEILAPGVELWLGDCREIAPTLGRFDAVITDPPYSGRTHRGHDVGSIAGCDGANRAMLGYDGLGEDDCSLLAHLFADATDGWIVWMHDHVLAPSIHNCLEARGRYVFAPLPFFQAGRSVRLTGDGPCSWTDWITVARTAKQVRWGTLPGGYIAGEGWNDKARMGGKPSALMRALVSDYSRPGDLVCDPFMGAGTTGVACVQTGRRFVGIEIDKDAFGTACRRISEELKRPRLPLPEPVRPAVQEAML